MRVAFFSDSYLPQVNGVVTQIRNLSAKLVEMGHEVIVVAPSPDAHFRIMEEGAVSAYLLPSIGFPTYSDYRITLPHSSRVLKRIARFRPDIVHVHTPFGVGWFGVRVAKKHGIPLIGTYHTLIPEFLMYLPLPFIKKTMLAKKAAWKYTNSFYSKCDVVTAPSLSMKMGLLANGLKKDVVVMPNAIDFGLFNSAAAKVFGKKGGSRAGGKSGKGKKLRLIYFGRVSYEKNIEVVIFALRHLLLEGVDCELSITGSGPATRYLKKIVEENKLASHVHFFGAMSGAELAAHVAGHDIFITASTIETQGLTILESMACGLPCVGADCLAIPDSVREGTNGYLFKPYDFVDAARGAKRLSEPGLRKKFSAAAVRTAKKYAIDKVAGHTLALYCKAISDF